MADGGLHVVTFEPDNFDGFFEAENETGMFEGLLLEVDGFSFEDGEALSKRPDNKVFVDNLLFRYMPPVTTERPTTYTIGSRIVARLLNGERKSAGEATDYIIEY